MIRPATVKDVPAMARLINSFAERGVMLYRAHAELYETLRDFMVFEAPSSDSLPTSPPPSPPAIIGVAALEIVWADLAELKSLAVDKAYHGQGIGRQLVAAILEEARRLRIQRVFSLTLEQAFFERCGFSVVDRHSLPLKVWSDCIKCSKRLECDEVAMVCTLFDQPLVEANDPNSNEQYHYEVPTPIVQLRLPPLTP